MDVTFAWLPGATLGAYLLMELTLRARGESSSLRAGDDDRGTTALIVPSLVFTGFLPAILHHFHAPHATRLPAALGWLAVVGLVAAMAGLLLRAWSMRVLGAAYSRTLRVSNQQSVVDSGPYRWVRHPGYTGSIVALTGANLAAGSWLGAVLAAVVLSVAYLVRISAEEQMLAGTLGPPYREYQSRTYRLVPRPVGRR